MQPFQSKLGTSYDAQFVTCRFHLQQCAERHARGAFLGDPDREAKMKKMEKMKVLVNEIDFTPTVTSYNKCYERLVQFFEEVNAPRLKACIFS